MEKMMELLANSDNMRMLVILAAGFCGYLKLNISFERKFYVLEKRFDSRIFITTL